MKLLFDENLSPKLPRLLDTLFPGSQHVRDCNLKGFPDENIWAFARANGFTIVSKDADFHQRSLLYGQPPKLVWLRLGNCFRDQLLQLIITHEQAIRELELDPVGAVLVLS